MKIRNLNVFMFLLFASASFSQSNENKGIAIIRDGVYTGQSRSFYTGEPYWGKVRMTVCDGKFTLVKFLIRDSALHETFSEGYAKHFAGNALYIRQTKNDSKGVKVYPSILIERQDTGKIDVISGATWSYNIFRASLREALKNAPNPLK